MRRKIFFAVFGVSAVVIVALAVIMLLANEAQELTVLTLPEETLLTSCLLLLVLCCAAAILISARIISPLRDAEPDAYKELEPLYNRVEAQLRSLKEGADELEEKQLSLQTVMENMTEGLILLDANALIMSINQSARSMLGLSGETKGKDIMAVCKDEILHAAVFSALGGSSDEALLKNELCSMHLITNPIQVEGALRGVVVLLFDITEQVEAETMRREFSANVSHELKTPLTSISGYAEIMRNGLVRSEDMSGFAGKIYDEAQRLIALIEDIIRLSRLDEKAKIAFQTVDLFEICGSVAERLQKKAEEAGVKLQLQGERCMLLGNPRLLDEMVYNLCENAIKYNHPGGNVSLHVAVQEGKPVLEVADTGVGIPREHQSRVFERFYRVDKSHSKETGGTGLGLSIVKRGAMMHNAAIELESAPGIGTTIRLCFGKIDN